MQAFSYIDIFVYMNYNILKSFKLISMISNFLIAFLSVLASGFLFTTAVVLEKPLKYHHSLYQERAVIKGWLFILAGVAFATFCYQCIQILQASLS